MGWTTVYISGRKGFQEAVRSKLKDLWVHGTPEVDSDLLLFWLNDSSELRDFKVSIGSRIILKYRLHFSTNLETYLHLDGPDVFQRLSIDEEKMVNKMVEQDKAKRLLLSGTSLVNLIDQSTRINRNVEDSIW